MSMSELLRHAKHLSKTEQVRQRVSEQDRQWYWLDINLMMGRLEGQLTTHRPVGNTL